MPLVALGLFMAWLLLDLLGLALLGLLGLARLGLLGLAFTGDCFLYKNHPERTHFHKL